MVCLPAGMTEELGGELLQALLPGLFTLQTEVLVLGKGSATYGALFTKLAKEQKHRLAIVPEKPEDMQAMYAACDMALFLSDAIPQKELTLCLKYGVVPICLPSSLLDDYNPVQETGNAFVYEQPTMWSCFAALVRAVETYKFPFDWKTIQKHCLESVRDK
jgi:glycogen synthase